MIVCLLKEVCAEKGGGALDRVRAFVTRRPTLYANHHMAHDSPFDGKPGQKATHLVDPVDTMSIRDATLRRGSFGPDSASGHGPKKND